MTDKGFTGNHNETLIFVVMPIENARSALPHHRVAGFVGALVSSLLRVSGLPWVTQSLEIGED